MDSPADAVGRKSIEASGDWLAGALAGTEQAATARPTIRDVTTDNERFIGPGSRAVASGRGSTRSVSAELLGGNDRVTGGDAVEHRAPDPRRR